jgi:hypothetical protein
MILRDLTDRARVEGMRAIRALVDSARGLLPGEQSSDLYVVRGASEHGREESVWWSRSDPDADADHPIEGPDADEPDVAKSLDHLAETIDRLAAQLDASHTERAEHLDAIEFLLRELVLGGAARPTVLGGIADRVALDEPLEITIVADGVPLEIDTPVEVRSRFHDRWICGFAIAEAIQHGPEPRRYRLTRRSDGIPLPILFDARDVRAVAAIPDRQPVTD